MRWAGGGGVGGKRWLVWVETMKSQCEAKPGYEGLADMLGGVLAVVMRTS